MLRNRQLTTTLNIRLLKFASNLGNIQHQSTVSFLFSVHVFCDYSLTALNRI